MRARKSGPVRRDAGLGSLPPGGSAPKCSNQSDLHLALADLFDGSDVPEPPSPTFMRLVCIQMLSLISGKSYRLWRHARWVRLPKILVGFTRMKCAGTPSIHGSSPASMNGARSASVSR
jgi:hypothetical protein